MPRPQQEDIPGVEGEGVSRPRIKELDRLGDKFIEIRDQKAELATKLTDTEKKMAAIMEERGLSTYSWADQVMTIKPGATHVKVKSVRAEGVEGEE